MNSVDDVPHKHKMDNVKELLGTIGECNGTLFGGFVRDIVVPYVFSMGCLFCKYHHHTNPEGPKCEHHSLMKNLKSFDLSGKMNQFESGKRDIDIFFWQGSSKNAFITMMGDRFTPSYTTPAGEPSSSHISTPEDTDEEYGCHKISGVYASSSGVSFKLDVVWGRMFPAYDVDVSELTCRYLPSGEFWFGRCARPKSFGACERLVEKILSRKAKITPTYWLRVTEDHAKRPERFAKRIDRIFGKYYNERWSVKMPDGMNLGVLIDVWTTLDIYASQPSKLPEFREKFYETLTKVRDMMNKFSDSYTGPLHLHST